MKVLKVMIVFGAVKYHKRGIINEHQLLRKTFKYAESDFIEKYLVVDEEGDFVAKSTPCPFLGADNYCSIYDQRPSDCHRCPDTQSAFWSVRDS